MNNRIITFIYLLIFGAFIFYMNSCYHFVTDDCTYALQWLPGTDVLPKTHGTIMTALKENWADGYRPIPHAFVRIFCGCFPKIVFNISNTMMLIALVLIIIRYATGAWRLSSSKVILTIAMVYVFLCKGESYLWCAGSLNYLWVAVPTLCFLVLREKVESGVINYRETILALPFAVFCGWLQEACVLPVCFALCVYGILTFRSLNKKKIFIYGAYGVGAILLLSSTIGRAINKGGVSLSFIGIAVNFAKILFGVKVLWVLAFVVVVKSGRIRWVKENLFELLVVLGSLLMMAIVGFTGERSLYAANLFGVVLMVRSVKPTLKMEFLLSACIVTLMLILIPLASRISTNFENCVRMYRESIDGVTIHERVRCGIFGRFFHQSIYSWQQEGHNLSFANFYGEGKPLYALTRNLYENLYLKDRICTAENKLPIEGEYYTTEGCSAIVKPVTNNCTISSMKYNVVMDYELPKTLYSRLKYELELRRNPVSHPEIFSNLHTPHGDYLLLVKIPFCKELIKGINFQHK